MKTLLSCQVSRLSTPDFLMWYKLNTRDTLQLLFACNYWGNFKNFEQHICFLFAPLFFSSTTTYNCFLRPPSLSLPFLPSLPSLPSPSLPSPGLEIVKFCNSEVSCQILREKFWRTSSLLSLLPALERLRCLLSMQTTTCCVSLLLACFFDAWFVTPSFVA